MSIQRQLYEYYRESNPPTEQTLKYSNLRHTINLNQDFKLMNQQKTALEQLQIKYDKNNTEDVRELTYILGNLLTYPSSQAANLHMEAHRLGTLDLKEFQKQKLNYVKVGLLRLKIRNRFALAVVSLGKIRLQTYAPILGVSTYLFFLNLKHLIVLLLILFFVYGIYSLVSNIVLANIYKSQISDHDKTNVSYLSYESFLVISLGSKRLNNKDPDKISFSIQCWLGVAVVVIWGILFAVIKIRERSKSNDIDVKTKKASDYTLLFLNFPKNMVISQLQLQLKQYCNKIANQKAEYEHLKQLKVMKVNKAIPFYLDKQNFDNYKLQQVNKKYLGYKKTFIKWIKQRKQFPKFTMPQQQRIKYIDQFEQVKKERIVCYCEVADNVKNYIVNRQQMQSQTVPAFVTFNTTIAKQNLLALHDDYNYFWNIFPCCKNQNQYFHFKNTEGKKQFVRAQIMKAPEPEDIYWTNLGQQTCQVVQKKLLTYTIAFLVLGASFGVVYGLSKVQYDYTQSHQDLYIQYISICISLVIAGFNILIQQTLRFLTKIQRNVTRSIQQISLAIKAILALLINSIMIPILVNRFFKNNLYGVNGLAYDIFYLGIANSFLSPLIRIFDIQYYFFRIVKWYQNKPEQKLHLNQNRLNHFTQHIEFQIGYEYIYVVHLFLFTCFFSSLQPIIIVFAIIGLIIMYWAQKNALFNRSRRPVPGNNSVNTAMYQLIYFGPAFYVIGSFCWSHFFQSNFIGIAPNLVAAIIAFVILIFPYKKVVKRYWKKQKQLRLYQDDKVFLASQYDRLNPATSQFAVKQFKQLLQQKKMQIMRKSPMEQQQFEEQFIKYNARSMVGFKPSSSNLWKTMMNVNVEPETDQEFIMRQSIANYAQKSGVLKKVHSNMQKKDSELQKQKDNQSHYRSNADISRQLSKINKVESISMSKMYSVSHNNELPQKNTLDKKSSQINQQHASGSTPKWHENTYSKTIQQNAMQAGSPASIINKNNLQQYNNYSFSPLHHKKVNTPNNGNVNSNDNNNNNGAIL